MKPNIVFNKPNEVATALGYDLSQQNKDALDKYFLGIGCTNSQGYAVCNSTTAGLIEVWYSKLGTY